VTKLNLGCGDKKIHGYFGVDIAASRAGILPDVICDLRKLPFGAGTIDEILSVHVVEHFWRWEVHAILMEWARVLKPGGEMILECPNLLTACREFINGQTAHNRTMWVFYGDPAWKDSLMVHRWGYTPATLAGTMAEAGLINLRQAPAQFKLREPRDFRIVGEKA
jgi:predicted SAM-dependent methyltransferase